MRYFVICKDDTAFNTDWYDDEMYNPETMICVIDLGKFKVTFDGYDWKDIEEDRL